MRASCSVSSVRPNRRWIPRSRSILLSLSPKHTRRGASDGNILIRCAAIHRSQLSRRGAATLSHKDVCCAMLFGTHERRVQHVPPMEDFRFRLVPLFSMLGRNDAAKHRQQYVRLRSKNPTNVWAL